MKRFFVVETIERNTTITYAYFLESALRYVKNIAEQIKEEGELDYFDENTGLGWGETANYNKWDIKIVKEDEIEHI